MALSQFFVFNANNFVNGQARLLYSQLTGASTDVAVPANPASLFLQKSPYTPATGWVDVGGTSSPPLYSRDLKVNEWKIQQKLASVLNIPQEVVRTIKIPAAEFARADLLGLFENGPAEIAITASSGAWRPQNQQPFGQFTDLNQYRVAIAAFQPLGAGTVNEGAGATRPLLVTQVFYRCSIYAENVQVKYGIGEMVTADVTLRLYAEPGQPQNSEYGCYFFETAGAL
jgi:hypothetical protein